MEIASSKTRRAKIEGELPNHPPPPSATPPDMQIAKQTVRMINTAVAIPGPVATLEGTTLTWTILTTAGSGKADLQAPK